ncbi:MAG: hypothetical protein COT71_02495 [Candidatus Andersenbacteria bacterium CG10_big_fil_rev_8_21_14_0_10_54_11]|uniref:Uncharacterized protein n=1 Tax=Candidatus Andersenbacteria bacterium CG10_big_fil_rev_8_21_14_0_10_54_11 TaxID=1974485 RepID=A0A2M6WZC3_9BACT|nr:MAG: hypothetical protein COT71_02495 [Candidatus Andersenbacteria bacterium CG10_big_fil_rev_8_21_14_0_10_54_11]
MDEQKISEYRREYRQRMGIDPEQKLLVYWSGGELDRVVSHLGELRGVISGRILFASRLHPKQPAREEMWRLLKAGFINEPDLLLNAHNGDLTEAGLRCAADAVIGEFGSTQTYAAALVGTRPIIAQWPDNKQK